jgi:hypothetical protein
VALVAVPAALPRATERLTGTGAGPDSGGVSKSGPPQGKRPSADPGEEVALVESGEFIGVHLQYAPLVHNATSDLARRDQLAEPRARLRVVVVVVDGHSAASSLTGHLP